MITVPTGDSPRETPAWTPPNFMPSANRWGADQKLCDRTVSCGIEPFRHTNNCWRGLHEFRARVVTGFRHWRSSRVAIDVGACDRSLGGASGLDQSFWLPPGFHGG